MVASPAARAMPTNARPLRIAPGERWVAWRAPDRLGHGAGLSSESNRSWKGSAVIEVRGCATQRTFPSARCIVRLERRASKRERRARLSSRRGRSHPGVRPSRNNKHQPDPTAYHARTADASRAGHLVAASTLQRGGNPRAAPTTRALAQSARGRRDGVAARNAHTQPRARANPPGPPPVRIQAAQPGNGRQPSAKKRGTGGAQAPPATPARQSTRSAVQNLWSSG